MTVRCRLNLEKCNKDTNGHDLGKVPDKHVSWLGEKVQKL
jgi:hypothetical protein